VTFLGELDDGDLASLEPDWAGDDAFFVPA